MTVDKPATLEFTPVRASLSRIVTLALDSDPSLIPISCKPLTATATVSGSTPAAVGGTGAARGASAAPAAGESEDGAGLSADNPVVVDEEDGIRDPDDFRFWSEDQAVRISKAIGEAFDVELTPEVIIADANLTALANRILVARDLLSD